MREAIPAHSGLGEESASRVWTAGVVAAAAAAEAGGFPREWAAEYNEYPAG